MSKYLAEFIATFILICVIGFTHSLLAIVLTIFFLVTIFLPISGCHINPAVSVGLWLHQKISWREVIAYICAQLLAAQCAAGFIYLVSGRQFLVKPGTGISWITAFLAEFIATFFLVLMIFLIVAFQNHRQKKKKAQLKSMEVAFIFVSFIFVAITIAGPISGAAFNPAVGLASLSSVFWSQGMKGEANLLPLRFLYLSAQITGATMAALSCYLFKKIRS